jgi:hypothetical protein
MPKSIEIPEALYEKLREIARACETIFCAEIAPYAGVNPKFVFPLFPKLDEVNRREHADKRPLLSAVVIGKEKGMPGPGFIENARELGVCLRLDDRACWEAELQRVHDHWRRR